MDRICTPAAQADWVNEYLKVIKELDISGSLPIPLIVSNPQQIVASTEEEE